MANLLGRQLGPYRVESELGCGGMGRVYTAVTGDPTAPVESADRVAVKVVHPHLLEEPEYVKRFVQEANAGRQVRHPNVVRTFHADTIDVDGDTVHFMVMEYVQGRNLRQLLEDFGTVPEPMLREIARQCAGGLAAIHEHQIVHRDIKPENILITEQHEVRIMDLGVSRMLETTLTISDGAHFAGSLLYGAPEQFVDDPVGPAADLYSLGATLYELASGINPFLRENFLAVMQAHLESTPLPLHHRNPNITAFFSLLVSKLVAKRPEGRFASAREVEVTLERAEESDWWTGTEPRLDRIADPRPSIPVRRDTELVGREHALATLSRAWLDAKAGTGATVLIEGEAGIGKTRLLDALVRNLPEDRMHVLYGSYPPTGGLGGISDGIVANFGEAGLAAALAPHLVETPSLVDSFAALIRQHSPPPGEPRISWDAYVSMCVQLLRSLAADRPLVWLIDDIQFAPKESRDAILAMARAVAGRNALLVLATRPGLPSAELAELRQVRNVFSIELGRLGAREVVEVLRSALGSNSLAEKLGGAIAYRSDGVPFFIFEMIRGLEQAHRIARMADGSYVQTDVIASIEVPDAIRDLVQERLRGLDRDQRAILDVGAVQGLRFDPALVANVLGMKLVQVLQEIAHVERETGLVRGHVGDIEFDQHQIQEVLYGVLLPDLRREYHALLAAAFAARLRDDPQPVESAFLALHGLQGGQPERWLPYLADGLDHLAATYRNQSLIEMVDRALELREQLDEATLVDLLLRKASRLGLLGRRQEELETLMQAAEAAEAPPWIAQVSLARARHLLNTSELSDAIDAANQVIQLECGPALELEARAIVGRALLQAGKLQEARSHFERRLELAKRQGTAASRSAAEGDLGSLEKALGNYPGAHAYFTRELSIARDANDRHAEESACGNLGALSKLVGNFPGAVEFLERQRRLARETGDRSGEASATGNLGLALKHLGRIEEAAALFEESADISREIGSRLGEARAIGHMGILAKGRGQFVEAQRLFEQARDLSLEFGDVHGYVTAVGNLGNIHFDKGRFEDARDCYELWLQRSREQGDRQGEAVAIGNLGNALEALGRMNEALGALIRTHRLARELGDREGEGIALADLGLVLSRLGALERAATKLEGGLAILRELVSPRSEACALHGLGAVAEQLGDLDEASRQYEAARKIYASLEFAVGESEAALAQGALSPASDRGRRQLEQAFENARALEFPSVFVRAACHLGMPEAAALLKSHAARMSAASRMEAHLLLWKSGTGAEHLAEAYALLSAVREASPLKYRNSMIEHVAVHREIVAAWATAQPDQ